MKKRLKFLPFLLLGLGLILNSCSEDETLNDLNQNSVYPETNLKSENVSYSEDETELVLGLLYIMEDLSFDNRVNDFDSEVMNEEAKSYFEANENQNYQSFGDFIESYAGLSSTKNVELLNYIESNSELIINMEAEYLYNLLINVYNSPAYDTRFETKGFFSSLINIVADATGTEVGACARAGMAFVETVISGAVMVATAPTGVGAVVGYANMAGSYAETIYFATQCDGTL